MKNLCKLALLIVAVSPLFSFAETAVVVSKSSAVDTLDKDVVSDIFLGKSPTFPNGKEAVPVELKDGQAARESFHSGATGKSQAQLKAYWSKMLFSGKGSPPKEVADGASMKALIADNPNMIGYIDGADVDDSVKVVLTF